MRAAVTPRRRRTRNVLREIVVHYMGRRKADYYRLVMLLTLAPLRSAAAGSPRLSGMYNGVKTALYKLKK